MAQCKYSVTILISSIASYLYFALLACINDLEAMFLVKLFSIIMRFPKIEQTNQPGSDLNHAKLTTYLWTGR